MMFPDSGKGETQEVYLLLGQGLPTVEEQLTKQQVSPLPPKDALDNFQRAAIAIEELYRCGFVTMREGGALMSILLKRIVAAIEEAAHAN